MNKKLFVLSALSALVLCGCPNTPTPVDPGDDPIEPGDVAVSEVTLDQATLALNVGASATLNATVKPDDATDKEIVWSSSNPEVATVSAGLVTAVKEGEATIKAAAHGDETKFAECKVTVSTPEATIDDLIAAIGTLGESVSGIVTRASGVKTSDTEKTTEEATFTLDQTLDYNVIEEVGGVALFEENSKYGYYMIRVNEDGKFEGEWGRLYKSIEEYKANELISSFGNLLVDAKTTYSSKTKTFAFTSSDIINAFGSSLGVSFIAGGEKFTKVSMKATEEGVQVNFFNKVSPTAEPIVVYELKNEEEVEYTDLENYLSEAAIPTSGISGNDSLTYNFGILGTYTSEINYGEEGLDEHEYVTDETYTTSRDGEAWGGQYAQYAYTNQYALVGEHKTFAPGVWRTLEYTNDPEKLEEAVATNTFSPRGGLIQTTATEAFWLTEDYYNPLTFVSYGYGLCFSEEKMGEFGQCYSMELGAEYTYTKTSGETVTETVTADDFALLNDCFGFMEMYDPVEYPEYGGYFVDEWKNCDMYIQYAEGEEPSYDTVEEILLVVYYDGGYISVNQDPTTGEYVPTIEEQGSFYDYKFFYDFGTTEDPFANAILGNAKDLNVEFTVNGEVAKSLELSKGDAVTLGTTVSVEGFDGTLAVTKGKDTVVTLADNGTLTAVGAGEAVITYTDTTTGNTYTFNVSVVTPFSPYMGKYQSDEEEPRIAELDGDGNFTFDGESYALQTTAFEGSFTFEAETLFGSITFDENGFSLHMTDGGALDVTIKFVPYQVPKTAEKICEDFNANLIEAGHEDLVAEWDDEDQEYYTGLRVGATLDESEEALAGNIEFVLGFMPEYLGEPTLYVYGDPTSPDYIDLYGDQSIYLYVRYETADGGVVELISYVYNGADVVEVHIYDKPANA